MFDSSKVGEVRAADVRKSNTEWLEALMSEWRNQKLIREVTRKIPSGILPEGIEGSMTDVSLNARGPDDGIFQKNIELRDHLPRGVARLRINVGGCRDQDSYVIYANKKFFECEELSSNVVPDEYFLQRCSNTTSVVAMEKINGEAAHFSGRFISGQFYLFAGSKNVHLIFQKKEHIDLYTDDRYSIARNVALAVLEKFEQMTEQNRSSLEKFLHSKRSTVVCEIMMVSRQHVVDFSGLNHNKLVVLALTPPPTQNQKSLTTLPSSAALQKFNDLGFDVADHETVSLSEMDEHILKTRRARQTEGIVYYYEDGSGNTIGLVKLKSSWYVHLRALRQQAAYRHTARKSPQKSLHVSKERSRHRMEELQKWLFTSDEELEGWKHLSDQWLEWLEGEVNKGCVPASGIKDNFPVIWKPFTAHVQITINCMYSGILS